MKIVKIIGGLGNQMFQYSFFLTLLNKESKVKLDISSFQNYPLHQGFELQNVFGIDIENWITSKEDLDHTKDKNKFFSVRKVLGRVFFSDPNRFIKSSHFIQPNFSHFYDSVFGKKNIYLDGYWQNEKYFTENTSLIRKVFQWRNVDEKNAETAKIMASQNSVSLHIRRFDEPKTFRQFFYLLRLRMVWRVAPKIYYLKAIEYINANIESPHFYIFTDNLNWVRKNLPNAKNFNLVDWNRKEKSNLDMYLMRHCKHHIISMSSFSWWGAWLSYNSEKIVIAPQKWALRFSSKVEIIPPKWIRL